MGNQVAWSRAWASDLEEEQIRLFNEGNGVFLPVRLIRIVDTESEIAFVWLVEDLTDGFEFRVVEDHLGQELNEMEVIAWACS